MKLTLEHDSFHFTISQNDMNRLLDGKSVKHNMTLGHSSFNYAIKPYDEDVFKLYLTPLSVVLFVSESRLRKLNGEGMPKNRLKTLQDGTRIVLDMEAEDKEKKSDAA